MWNSLLRRFGATALLVLACGLLLCPAAVRAQGEPPLAPGTVYWYVPAHEKYGRTIFYSSPSFSSLPASVPNRTQEFRLIGAQKGWAQLEFGTAKVYLHLRVLRGLMYSPTAIDSWAEFQRSSVFTEHPDRIDTEMNKRRATGAPSSSPTEKRPRALWTPKSFGKAPVAPKPDGETDPSAAAVTAPGTVPGTGHAKASRSIVRQPQPDPEPTPQPRPTGDPEKPADDIPR